ncbi:MAG TPA: AraC family transcriptional regulator [Pyrinomonadaceae bacterium]|jgi:AraC-like DNA-binding protein
MLITLPHNFRFSISSETIPSSKSLAKSSSYILKTRAREYYRKAYYSHLSIKAASAGEALFETNNGRYMPDQDTYLILNPEQEYALTIDSQTEVTGIIIFFAAGFPEEVYRSMTAPTGLLLDEPQAYRVLPLEFIQRLHQHDNILSPSLKALWESLDIYRAEQAWYDEQLHQIMQRLLRVHWNVCQEIDSLPAMRTGTRKEIYRRIYRARDYIAASLGLPLTLNEMARVACLSPNHFMRTFKQVFRLTPHQYLTGLRLQTAKQLLRQTELSVTEVCFRVGFESLGHFSWLFRRRVGMPPQEYRKHNKSSFP